MTIDVLIAHAKGEAAEAEKLAEPLRAAGYRVTHDLTVGVGDSVVAEASRLMMAGAPVVLCGTVRAVGTKWGRRVVNAARGHDGVRVFIVQMEEDADTDMLAFDEVIARHWEDPAKAEQQLVDALAKYYPPGGNAVEAYREQDLEARYREVALKSCDIIDLANLPEDDRHLATRELALRRLYVALRLRVEVPVDAKEGEADKRFATLDGAGRTRWGEAGVSGVSSDELTSLGARLAENPRLVVLGDPGAGKTTMLRWLATAYLLQLKNDPDFESLPDIESLPDTVRLPVIVRCRDLPPEAVTVEDMIHHSLRSAGLREEDCRQVGQLVWDRLIAGEALLMIDGLDEISESMARARFSRSLEQFCRAHEKAAMVVTSRIVGYREMGYRLRANFEHLTVADLTREDKDDFARRWTALVERPERRDAAADELIRDLHSSDRIERLTGNPMLLTTMALVKRKVGRLPQRRVDLYESAVEVLLNWRSEVDEPIDKREALPQLEYLAYAMCDRGVQRLREDEVLGLLRGVREEYPSLHLLKDHSPERFLERLERRTGLLIQSGFTRHDGQSVPVYEFRHLTFQEYLAGIALVQGHFPDRDRDKTLAEHVAPLAGRLGKSERDEVETSESWREALRLCVTACNDDDVDECILAILEPLLGETETERPRAVMAALCLADEPNVSEVVAKVVLTRFTHNLTDRDGQGGGWHSNADLAAKALAETDWQPELAEALLDEFFARPVLERDRPGVLYAMTTSFESVAGNLSLPALEERLAKSLALGDRAVAAASLTLMQVAYKTALRIDGKIERLLPPLDVKGLMRPLLSRLAVSAAAPSHALAWAALWLVRIDWKPTPDELVLLVDLARRLDDPEAVHYIIWILETHPTSLALDVLLVHIDAASRRVRARACSALGKLRDLRAVPALVACLGDPEARVREEAILALEEMDWASLSVADRGRLLEQLCAIVDSDGRGMPERTAAAKTVAMLGTDESDFALANRMRVDSDELRRSVFGARVQMIKDSVDRKLLSRDLDSKEPWLDPETEIDPELVKRAANGLELEEKEVRRRLEALADRFGLKLAWRTEPSPPNKNAAQPSEEA